MRRCQHPLVIKKTTPTEVEPLACLERHLPRPAVASRLCPPDNHSAWDGALQALQSSNVFRHCQNEPQQFRTVRVTQNFIGIRDPIYFSDEMLKTLNINNF